MMIALPNQDCSWTVTLFMPFTNFKKLDTKENLITFFEKYFPDSIPLIGKQKLVENFFATSPSPLVTVKVIHTVLYTMIVVLSFFQLGAKC